MKIPHDHHPVPLPPARPLARSQFCVCIIEGHAFIVQRTPYHEASVNDVTVLLLGGCGLLSVIERRTSMLGVME